MISPQSHLKKSCSMITPLAWSGPSCRAVSTNPRRSLAARGRRPAGLLNKRTRNFCILPAVKNFSSHFLSKTGGTQIHDHACSNATIIAVESKTCTCLAVESETLGTKLIPSIFPEIQCSHALSCIVLLLLLTSHDTSSHSSPSQSSASGRK